MNSKKQRQELSPISVESVIDEIIGLNSARAKAKGLVLTFQCDKPLPIVAGDAFLLKQSLKILLGNAIKFTHEGKIELIAKAAKEYIDIHIIDTGNWNGQ